jgi:hypothetical protein
MALLIQPLIDAVSSGGGLSQTAEGGMILSATWGLGEAIAQGEIVPDRYGLDVNGTITSVDTGRKTHKIGCHLHDATPSALVPKEMAANFMSFSPRIDASDDTIQIQSIAIGNDFALSDSLS